MKKNEKLTAYARSLRKNNTDALSYDERRSRFLESKGYKVIRFWNNEIFRETEAVLEVIIKELGCV